MLMQIHIRDLATIENLQLELGTGCTMITGETGAGKSIFIEAIEFALGGRSSPTLVRPGKDKVEVSLTFDVTRFQPVIQLLKSLDLYQHAETECIIRRTLTHDGRSRCYVNGSPATLPLLKELGEKLFHLHGQYDQQVLLKSETQRDMLDRFADLLADAAEIKLLAEEWKMLENAKNDLTLKCHERRARSDYLQFQLEELEALQLKEGEWENLEEEHLRLTHAEELMRQVQLSLHYFNEDEQNIITLSNEVRRLIENIIPLEPQAKTWLDSLQNALIQLTDIESELQNYLDKMTLDPAKLQTVENRVSTIFNLSRKHKIAPQALASFTKELQQAFASLQSSDSDLHQLIAKQQAVWAHYHAKARLLSEGRKQAAVKLEQAITKTIRSLSLPHGEFTIAFETITDQSILHAHGIEKTLFLIKTNPDQTMQPLTKVISGGELSRLSLAIHLALAHRTNIPTLIFDEVDTGVSGATAEKIGRLLHKLGMTYQVFCVTHQPQVAACGHHHLLVKKYFIDNTTHTHLQLLSSEEKTQEIARMLGGEKITAKTVEHAREVLEKACT